MSYVYYGGPCYGGMFFIYLFIYLYSTHFQTRTFFLFFLDPSMEFKFNQDKKKK